MNWTPCTMLAVLVCAAPLVANDPVPVAKKQELVTRTYDLKPILNAQSRPPGLTDLDGVIRLILETVDIGELKSGGPSIVERENGQLEIRARLEVHGEIADLLEALQRLGNVAVDVRINLVELEAPAAEKLSIPALGVRRTAWGLPVPTPQSLIDSIAENGKTLQSSKSRCGNGVDCVVSARRSLVRFPASPGLNAIVVKEGYRLTVQPIVSADRRSVRLKLAEQATAITGIKQMELGEFNGKPLVATTPAVEEFGRTATVEIADGAELLFRLSYAPAGKVWVVALRTTIFVAEEERDLQKEKK